MRRRRLFVAMLSASLLSGASALAAGLDAGTPPTADAGVSAPDAGPRPRREGSWTRAGDPDPAPPPDACAGLDARLARRKAWLAARRQEQFEKGGPPDPAQGIPNMIGVWCSAHPEDEECGLGNVAIEVDTAEIAWDAAKTPEDYDAHVIVMKRQIRACRERRGR